ncbi:MULTISPECIES: response regulator [unclassified Lysobacter]|uniref:Hpt domain-containing response regulator n=1 Tax=unclassified Lysobacter TaxID=2635362 RepID=UPI001BEB93F7|nr:MULTISPECIES: response regulator [unclassified Lysobacter]MBT2748220.1 response regulator [Lysobacter sp. ISL-42]MBT2753286.1 response regulator [Lysobacter sp. ISL-50]MBT2779011.1 response regulator [Lysobacter sp. ISL-54]MBT2784171.1 response regulator [Lysobacter sp. ISL-52]
MKNPQVPRVLLVEDDPTSRAFLTAAVEAVPAYVDGADSLASAMALSASQDYQLWLFDAHLPDGSGIDLLERLRRRHPRTPALAHTATGESEVRDRLIASGFSEVLVKPLPAAAVRCAIRRLLGLPEHDQPAAPAAGQSAVWDDDGAARALNGNRAHIATLRGLFTQELPNARRSILAAAQLGNLEAMRGELHKLRASCGFVGAARLGEAVQALQTQPDSQALLNQFDLAAQDTIEQAG